MLLAVAPLGVLILLIVGAVFGREAAGGELMAPLGHILGDTTAEFISDLIERAQAPAGTWWASTLTAGFFVVVTVRLFIMLRASLNHIFGVRVRRDSRGRNLFTLFQKRAAAVIMVLVFCATALVYVVARVAVATTIGWMEIEIDAGWRVVDFAISTVLGVLLVSLFFRFLPDVRIAWKDIIIGACVTSVLSVAGSVAIGYYLRYATTSSMFGAAGSLVVLLLWVYYSSHLFFWGAEFTGVWARMRGSGIHALGHASVVTLECDQRMSIEPGGAEDEPIMDM
jgi:membrane protein